MITLTFPDGAARQYEAGITGRAIAEGIAKSLAKRTVAMALDGNVVDLADPIAKDAKIEFLTRDDPRALELIRHDAAHVLAEAVQELFPGTQVTIGPVIENGFYYDFARNEPFTPDDFAAIEEKMREIIAEDRPFTKEVWPREKARKVFADKGEGYKLELIDAIPEDQDLKIYAQGEWFDLCRGPHMASTGKIGNAFKLMKVAGAYWRGDSNNPMLTRIYGTALATRRSSMPICTSWRKPRSATIAGSAARWTCSISRRRGRASCSGTPRAGRCSSAWSPTCAAASTGGYQEVNAPQMLDKSLWETSGHWGWYRDNMFKVTVAGDETEDDRGLRDQADELPGPRADLQAWAEILSRSAVALAEFGAVHRYEPSGALHGLMRVRGFTQDDAHIFCTEEQLAAECLKINDLILSTYADFGFDEISVKLSTRPDKRVGTDEMWDHAEDVMGRVLEQIAAQSGDRIKTGDQSGRGRVLRAEVRICAARRHRPRMAMRHDAGRLQPAGTLRRLLHRCTTEKKQPVMVHRAICGSMERFLGILIENYSGHFPLWFAPVQVVVATITSDADDYATRWCGTLEKAGLRVDADLRNEKINYKVREHSLAKVPVILVGGKQEAEERTV